jgi:Domain of Unknown Function (DUF1543)
MDQSTNPLHLYMLLLGCKPKGRNTEQHDVFFGIAPTLKDLLPAIYQSWPEAEGNLHIDAWRRITAVDGCIVSIKPRDAAPMQDIRLFFINLGGYKQDEFEEYHYKMLVAAPNKGVAIQKAKQTAFYKHTGFKGAESHVDDKYGVDVDDLYEISEILPESMKQAYSIVLTQSDSIPEDDMQLGYLKTDKL